MRRFSWLPLAALLACSAGGPPAPNVVILVADDLGWAEVGYHGSDVLTPNLDALAREGVELDRFYVTPICSPTRAGLMTGRYPIRFGMMRAVVKPWRDVGLPFDEVTLPQVLARAGYEHRGIFGKWHLGHLRRQWHPLEKGFTEFIGSYNGWVDYHSHYRMGQRDWHEGFEPSYEPGYTSDLIASHAAEFVTRHSADEAPYFLFVAFNAPHWPYTERQSKPDMVELYRDWIEAGVDPERIHMAAMITGMDAALGEILRAIDESGEAEDTLVLFLSDNGGDGETMHNTPLRGEKGQVFEGGIRAPASIRWPRGIPGGRVVTAPIAYIDMLPTLMRIAGIDDHGGKPLDGRDVLPILDGSAEAFDRPLYSHSGDGFALTEGGWKLVLEGDEEPLLFRLRDDPNETTNVSEAHPEIARNLRVELDAFRALQRPDAIPLGQVGREGFEAPPDWRIPDS